MTPLDRLKLSRDDYDQQEKLYNSLVLGMRFYIGISVILAGASISLSQIDHLRAGCWSSWLILITAILFWISLLTAMYHLFRMVLGEPWTMPRSMNSYLEWKAERLKQVESGEFETGDKTPEEFAEEEMLCQMASAYAASTDVNREGNLSRQRRVMWVGKFLLASLIGLGLQGVANVLYSLHNDGRQGTETNTTHPAASGTHRHD